MPRKINWLLGVLLFLTVSNVNSAERMCCTLGKNQGLDLAVVEIGGISATMIDLDSIVIDGDKLSYHYHKRMLSSTGGYPTTILSVVSLDCRLKLVETHAVSLYNLLK